jgi:tetratricopeptide (TPR) repeat protein
MSPEQAAGQRDLTPASDLYSLGVLLYEMIAGAFPYAVAAPPNYMLAHVTGQPVPLVARVGDVPVAVEAVVMRLLAKEPAARYASADEVTAALDDAMTELPAPRRARSSGPAAGRARGRLRRAGILVTALVAAGAVALGLSARGPEPPAEDPRRSVLVGFFQNLTGDPGLEWLRVGGVEYLAQSLGRWDDLAVVDAERLLDLARRAELPEGAALSREDALQLARAAGMRTATVGTVLPLAGDTLRLTVRVYDVGSGELVTTATAQAVGEASLPGAFTSLADQILSLAGAPTGALPSVEPPTRSIEAYRAYVEGIEARSRWDIDEAVAAFRRAVQLDSSFALAYYELSYAVLAREGTNPEAPFVALADSALRWSAGRPERERLLIAASHALVHADLPRARELYTRLLAIDSSIADAWSGLGDAAWLDMTLRRDARGREYLPADLTLALHAYERALALDAGDHRVYPQLANLLLGASLEENRAYAAFREPPPGSIQTVMLRSPARFYSILMIGDSIVTVPEESLAVRFPGRTVDSLRARARERAREVLRRWLAVAPDEGQAYLWLATIAALDRDYDAALRALAAAERLGTSTERPFEVGRLGLFLEARRWDDAARLGDSLLRLPEWRTDGPPERTITAGALANWLLASGRPAAASERAVRYFQTLGRFEVTPRARREFELVAQAAGLRIRVAYGLADSAAVARELAAIQRQIADAPAEERARLHEVVGWTAVVATAFTGDTAELRRWRGTAGRRGRPGLDAYAVLLAGDRARAERLYASAARDTSLSPSHFFALARTAEGLGRLDEALRWYGMMDSSRVGGSMGIDPDWPLVVRGYAHRGALLEALGRPDDARRSYRTVLELWRDAEPAVRPQREAVARALGELERGDAGDRPLPAAR